MREQLLAAAPLTDGDRAALQGLIPLAGAVGAGTIFSLFAGGRRGRSGSGRLRLTLLEPGAKDPERTREILGDDDRLFDVSDLVR